MIVYQKIYEEIAEDTSEKIRQDEMRAVRHSINLLAIARKVGPNSREAVEALFFFSRLWSTILQDLASPENGLPRELRAKIISIGIWMLKHAEAIRQDKESDFQPLIDISENIYIGLKAAQC